MKTLVKIVIGLAILVFAFVAYFTYQVASERGAVDNIIEASSEYYSKKSSFDGFCEVGELGNAKNKGFDILCEDSEGQVSLRLENEYNTYSCNSATARTADGSDTKRLACVKLDIPTSSSESSATIGYNSELKFESGSAIKTSQDPLVCETPAFTELEQGLSKVERAIMPGVYTGTVSNTFVGDNYEGDREEFLKEQALKGSLAVKDDGSICYCNISGNPNIGGSPWEVIVSETGVIDEDGLIEWFGNKISGYENISASRNVGKFLVSLVNPNGSYEIRGFQLEDKIDDNPWNRGGCRGGSEYEPFELLTEDDVCGCSIETLN